LGAVEANTAISRQARAGGATARLRLMAVFGTRPEAIKMAPVVAAAAAHPDIDVHVCATGQHRQMLDETMKVFGLTAHSDLNIMRPNQTLGDITMGVVKGVQETLAKHPCDWLLVQGDTTSAFAAALAAFYGKVKIAHVEAGLRTGDKTQPWPEEANRQLVSVIADRHYAPTEQARANLLRENVPEKDIIVTGNTVIDALLSISARIDREPQMRAELDKRFDWLDSSRRLILVTGHRRESFGEGFQNICRALNTLAQRSDIQIVYPVHLNPNVRGPVFELLSGLDNVRLIEPVDYVALIHLLKRCYFVLTDSGGIQEEAPSLNKPVLVMRSTSERMEAVHAGVARLVGADPDRIVSEAARLLDDFAAYKAMSAGANPFGDGAAAQRIIEDLLS
jgi:UDP-N-acetylglucosamine 2-epimerase (non-hydrolysing)